LIGALNYSALHPINPHLTAQNQIAKDSSTSTQLKAIRLHVYIAAKNLKHKGSSKENIFHPATDSTYYYLHTYIKYNVPRATGGVGSNFLQILDSLDTW